MANEWFYADAQNQQQGPIADAALASAFRSGTVNAATLVWREGLANWGSLSVLCAHRRHPLCRRNRASSSRSHHRARG
jgi:hypothetical protein